MKCEEIVVRIRAWPLWGRSELVLFRQRLIQPLELQLDLRALFGGRVGVIVIFVFAR